jgi:hypothetical protein
MLSYSEAQEMLSRARHGRRKLENNTYLEARQVPQGWAGKAYGGDGPHYAVRLHKTDIVTIHPDDSQHYDSGGWRTVTTKDRINRYGLALVYSERGTWYVQPHDHKHPVAHLRAPAVFADGMRIFPCGKVEGAGIDTTTARERVLKQVAGYVKGFAAHVAENGLAAPSSGDCWGCAFQRADTDAGSLPPGQREPMGLDHYFSHFKERYYVPSLLWRACQRAGNPAFAYGFAVRDAQAGRPDYLKRLLRSHFRPLIPALVEYAAR